MYERIRKYYRKGLYSREMVLQFAAKGVITLEEAESIINERKTEEAEG